MKNTALVLARLSGNALDGGELRQRKEKNAGCGATHTRWGLHQRSVEEGAMAGKSWKSTTTNPSSDLRCVWGCEDGDEGGNDDDADSDDGDDDGAGVCNIGCGNGGGDYVATC